MNVILCTVDSRKNCSYDRKNDCGARIFDLFVLISAITRGKDKCIIKKFFFSKTKLIRNIHILRKF